MIHIRHLSKEDLRQAVELRAACWTEELAGKVENMMSVPEELDFWTDWMQTAREHNDIRLLLGAFEQGELIGAAFGSIAETTDIPENGMELNGLWVAPGHRNRGISLMLVLRVLDAFLAEGMEKIVIYNHHYAPSNRFYHKFGATVARQDLQMDGRLLVDVFIADLLSMKKAMEQSAGKNKPGFARE